MERRKNSICVNIMPTRIIKLVLKISRFISVLKTCSLRNDCKSYPEDAEIFPPALKQFVQSVYTDQLSFWAWFFRLEHTLLLMHKRFIDILNCIGTLKNHHLNNSYKRKYVWEEKYSWKNYAFIVNRNKETPWSGKEHKHPTSTFVRARKKRKKLQMDRTVRTIINSRAILCLLLSINDLPINGKPYQKIHAT